jgi:hypothetical protein
MQGGAGAAILGAGAGRRSGMQAQSHARPEILARGEPRKILHNRLARPGDNAQNFN